MSFANFRIECRLERPLVDGGEAERESMMMF